MRIIVAIVTPLIHEKMTDSSNCLLRESIWTPFFISGELTERSMVLVLKTRDLERGPRVRIPHSPPHYGLLGELVKPPDCKSGASRHSWFESRVIHQTRELAEWLKVPPC